MRNAGSSRSITHLVEAPVDARIGIRPFREFLTDCRLRHASRSPARRNPRRAVHRAAGALGSAALETPWHLDYCGLNLIGRRPGASNRRTPHVLSGTADGIGLAVTHHELARSGPTVGTGAKPKGGHHGQCCRSRLRDGAQSRSGRGRVAISGKTLFILLAGVQAEVRRDTPRLRRQRSQGDGA